MEGRGVKPLLIRAAWNTLWDVLIIGAFILVFTLLS